MTNKSTSKRSGRTTPKKRKQKDATFEIDRGTDGTGTFVWSRDDGTDEGVVIEAILEPEVSPWVAAKITIAESGAERVKAMEVFFAQVFAEGWPEIDRYLAAAKPMVGEQELEDLVGSLLSFYNEDDDQGPPE